MEVAPPSKLLNTAYTAFNASNAFTGYTASTAYSICTEYDGLIGIRKNTKWKYEKAF